MQQRPAENKLPQNPPQTHVKLKALLGSTLSPTSHRIKVKGPTGIVRELTTAEFNQEFGVNLAFGIFYQEQDERLLNTSLRGLKDTPDAAKVRNFLNNPKHYFDVQYMTTKMGYGLVANQDIPEGTVVGIYSGELVDNPDTSIETLNERAYDMGYVGNFNLRANKTAGLERFAPHCPSYTDVVFGTKLDKTIELDKVVTANMNYPLAIVDGKPIRYYVTTEAIKKGDFCRINYGMGYWTRRGKPDLLVRGLNSYKIAAYSSAKDKYFFTNENISYPAEERKEEKIQGEVKKPETPAPKVVRLSTPPVIKPVQMPPSSYRPNFHVMEPFARSLRQPIVRQESTKRPRIIAAF